MEKQNRIDNKILAIFTVFLIVAVTMGAALASQHNVAVVVDGITYDYKTGASTVGEFLENEDIPFKEHGYINAEVGTPIYEGMVIEITNPIEIDILDGGVEKTVMSGYKNVEDILNQHGIVLDDKDYSVPSIKANIQISEHKNPLIIVNRVETEEIVSTQPIPHDKIAENRSDMPKGQEKIVTQGKDGVMEVKSEKLIVNGQEMDTRVIGQSVSQEPVAELKYVGTKDSKSSQISSKGSSSKKGGGGSLKGRKVKRTITMEATAYDPSPASNGQWAGITALGTKLRPGVVAVDPKVIPLGSRVYVESTDSWPDYGMASAEDTGGAIKGNRIDLLFMDRKTVYNFGRRTVKVHVLE